MSDDPVAALHALLHTLKPVDLAPKLVRGIPRWPSHPHLVIDKTITHSHDGYYCQSVSMAEHTGCHVDAPAHCHEDKDTIDKVSPLHLFAPAVLYDFADITMQPGDMLTAEMLENYERQKGVKVGNGEIALINFGWMTRYWRADSGAQWYAINAPGITEEAVVLLKERGVKAVGADTVACEIPLVDGRRGGSTGHDRHWLPNDILIIEMLTNLEQLSLRSYFTAAPLFISEGSGSPLRPLGFCAT